MIFSRKPDTYIVQDAIPADLPRIADLHELGFARGWSLSELMALQDNDANELLVARTVGRPADPVAGFNIIRKTEVEAEIISISVAPDLRGNGIADQLMREAIRRLQADRVLVLFLEVDETNKAALKLYRKLGFTEVGRRPGYYGNDQQSAGSPSKPSDALVMRLELV